MNNYKSRELSEKEKKNRIYIGVSYIISAANLFLVVALGMIVKNVEVTPFLLLAVNFLAIAARELKTKDKSRCTNSFVLFNVIAAVFLVGCCLPLVFPAFWWVPFLAGMETIILISVIILHWDRS